MRIYCSTRGNELDKFVGQDIWVLCEIKRVDINTKESYWGRIPAWVRFVSQTPDTYTINLTLGNREAPVETRLLNEREIYTTRQKTLPKDRFRLVKPAQAYTSDEFFSEEEEE